jgi:hypothetical protein
MAQLWQRNSSYNERKKAKVIMEVSMAMAAKSVAGGGGASGSWLQQPAKAGEKAYRNGWHGNGYVWRIGGESGVAGGSGAQKEITLACISNIESYQRSLSWPSEENGGEISQRILKAKMAGESLIKRQRRKRKKSEK